MFAVETQLPPEPLLLAERLWAEPGAALLHSTEGLGLSYVTCWPVEHSFSRDPEPMLSPYRGRRADAAGGAWSAVPRWIGTLPYESERRRLERPRFSVPEQRAAPHHEGPQWSRYAAVAVIGSRVTVVGENRCAVSALHERLCSRRRGEPGRLRLTPCAEPESLDLHRERIREALSWIREGELYQVNVARRLTYEMSGSFFALGAAMLGRAKAPFGALLKESAVASSSPELLLHTTPDGRALTLPIKGTRPRGCHAVVDQQERDDLEGSAKERAELAMVADIERSDLGRLSVRGGVLTGAPYIAAHASIFHRETRINARLRDGLSRTEILDALMPSGSITGAPKVRAMECIAQLESTRRGLYTGAVGYIDTTGHMTLSMAIRMMTVRDGQAHYHVGGGIVAGSDVEAEVAETHWKSVQVSSLVG